MTERMDAPWTIVFTTRSPFNKAAANPTHHDQAPLSERADREHKVEQRDDRHEPASGGRQNPQHWQEEDSLSREVDSEADYLEASKKAEHALEKGERGDNCQSTRPLYGSRHDALISVLLHTLHRMWRTVSSLFSFAASTSRRRRIVTLRDAHRAYLVPRCRAFR